MSGHDLWNEEFPDEPDDQLCMTYKRDKGWENESCEKKLSTICLQGF